MILTTTKTDPLLRSFIEIKASKPISKCPGIAFLDRKKEHNKLIIEGSIGSVAEGILKTLMNDLLEDGEPVIDKVTIHPGGIWILIAKGIGMPPEKIIGFAEGVLAHAITTD